MISLCCLGPTKLSLILNGFILEGFVILISGHKPRLPLSFYPWCHLFLSMVSFLCCSLVAKSCPTLCDLMHWSTSGSSVCGNSQARMLECAAISFPTQGSNPHLLHWQADSLPCSHLEIPHKTFYSPVSIPGLN